MNPDDRYINRIYSLACRLNAGQFISIDAVELKDVILKLERAEKKLAEFGIAWQDEKVGYVFNG